MGCVPARHAGIRRERRQGPWAQRTSPAPAPVLAVGKRGRRPKANPWSERPKGIFRRSRRGWESPCRSVAAIPRPLALQIHTRSAVATKAYGLLSPRRRASMLFGQAADHPLHPGPRSSAGPGSPVALRDPREPSPGARPRGLPGLSPRLLAERRVLRPMVPTPCWHRNQGPGLEQHPGLGAWAVVRDGLAVLAAASPRLRALGFMTPRAVGRCRGNGRYRA
jgi:hypothetical protein